MPHLAFANAVFQILVFYGPLLFADGRNKLQYGIAYIIMHFSVRAQLYLFSKSRYHLILLDQYPVMSLLSDWCTIPVFLLVHWADLLLAIVLATQDAVKGPAPEPSQLVGRPPVSICRYPCFLIGPLA